MSTAFVWGYGHVFVFAAIAVLGAGVAAELDLLSDHSKTTSGVISWWIGAPIAVLFVALWVTRDRHFSLGPRGYALPIAALGSVIAAWLGAPGWAFGLLTVAALIGRVPLFSRSTGKQD